MIAEQNLNQIKITLNLRIPYKYQNMSKEYRNNDAYLFVTPTVLIGQL